MAILEQDTAQSDFAKTTIQSKPKETNTILSWDSGGVINYMVLSQLAHDRPCMQNVLYTPHFCILFAVSSRVLRFGVACLPAVQVPRGVSTL